MRMIHENGLTLTVSFLHNLYFLFLALIPPSLPTIVNCFFLDTHTDEACQEFRGQVVPQIEAVHNLREVRMYLNVLSLRSTS